MEFAVITGLSGSGKTQVARFLEDSGYFCIDNLPPMLIPKFAEMLFSVNSKYDKAAVVIDTRVGDMINELLDNLQIVKRSGHNYRLIFMQASDDALVKRYKETRRMHPMQSENGLLSSIKKERALLGKLYDAADVVIDTSELSVNDLYERLREVFSENSAKHKMKINILAFGFKYGLPMDADLVFDVRCFLNPFYIDSLRELTGNDRRVQDYVLSEDSAKEFLKKLTDMLSLLLPLYAEEGKANTTVAIGCTGGKHRSVTFANKLGEALAELEYDVNMIYRDIEKGKRE